MSNGPNMRDLIRIVESHNRSVTEEEIDEMREAYEKAPNETQQESPIKALRKILQDQGIDTGRGYNDKNVGNRKIRVYTTGGHVEQPRKFVPGRKGPSAGRSREELEAIVKAGMEKAGYQVRKVYAHSGMKANNPDYHPAGHEAKMFPNVAVWLEGNPVGSRYQKELDEEPGDSDHGYNYEANENDFEPATNMCPDCEGTGESRMSRDSAFPGLGYDCKRCNGEGAIFEDDKPYATMDDGPDKYLFRKDGKQKLVGSADNEPENGEEELEETDMDKFIREMQIAAGIKLNEETGGPFDSKKDAQSNAKSEIGGGKEGTNFKTHKKDDGWYWTEKVDGGKLPDALKKHQFGAKDDDDSNDSDDDKEAVDEDVINWMKRFDRLSTPVNEEEKVDEEVIEEDCPTDPEKNADGDCSPFTHADENVAMVREDDITLSSYDDDMAADEYELFQARRGEIDMCDLEGHTYNDNSEFCTYCDHNINDEVAEDLLLAPQDKAGPEVDEDDMVYGKGRKDPFAGVDTTFSHEEPLDDIEDFSRPELDHPRYPNDIEEGPGDGDFTKGYTDDSMIDVGDEEDYRVYDFDNEFEAMLGGSSDMPEAELVGMYEMNNLRRLAGLEQIMEEENEEPIRNDFACRNCSAMSEDECVCDVEFGDKGIFDEDHAAGAAITDDLIAYEIDDETAYYAMQDILGSELDFGPQDEILVPAARNDQVLAALDQQGFKKGIDFWVVGEQYEDDLQNGYNDRKFSDGQDYFPKGAQNQPSSDLGPSASGMADNPMSNKMRMVKKDDVYETMKLAYRRFRKA